MDDASDESGRPRKVRKGTHSCRECRRRKVRCTFASARDTICITCHRRGTQCISQGIADGLEKHIQHNDAFDQSVGEITLGSLDGSSVYGGYHRHGGQLEQSPGQLLTPRLSTTPASTRITTAEPTAYSQITYALLSVLPPRRDIEILLGKVGKSSTWCYQSNFKARNASVDDLLKDPIAVSTLLTPDSHPVLLARQMLLFAAALQHLSPTAAIPGLTKPHHVIMEELADSAIHMVTTNDRLLGTLEALENIILESYYHVDSGNIRRAWITLHRAITGAQLLGLHQPGHYRYRRINEHNDLNPEVMWLSIVTMERVCSLLLGLPTSVGTTTPGVPETPLTEGTCDLPTLAMRITARILDRNQLEGGERAQEMTREIDQEFIKMTRQLPSTFWRPPVFSGIETDSVEAFIESRRAWDHMCYYTLLTQLHLPYMLCTSHTPGVIYSRIACVNASREILTRQIAFRTFNPIISCSRMGDFLALIAGMTLILAHLVSHSQNEKDNLLVYQRLGDRATVEQALECMKYMWEMHEDVLAARCAATLRDLLAIEEGAARGPGAGECDCDSFLMIKVPYVGAIRIAPDGIRPMTASETEKHRGPNNGVTIGGIGSIELKSLNSSDYRPGDLAGVSCVPTDTANVQPVQPHVHQTDQDLSDEYFTSDQMFPDAAAPMDDWVFQGVDSAFFDVLMRGVGEQQLNSGAELTGAAPGPLAAL
ncbi:hypothetical protein BJY01DRAFT_190654 [Aspergillus pseudoustus]|uniref:Zn(2)-C6 fungal-type domain-containing protein n=1 Tax=Aspergillus pseudoustus TaxID=1810923 RepID=A0ABR4JVN4_9EURO